MTSCVRITTLITVVIMCMASSNIYPWNDKVNKSNTCTHVNSPAVQICALPWVRKCMYNMYVLNVTEQIEYIFHCANVSFYDRCAKIIFAIKYTFTV